ncbi:MAG: DUF1080 domain-containing protein [Acidobacteria bacterium]|nr:DUF1080 domain-containing protein [Acidobacteriota bacterium]
MRRVQNLRVFVCTAGTLLLVISALPFAGAQQPATPAPAQANPARPTAPPPGAPAPGSRCLGCGVAPEVIQPNDYTGWTSIFDGRTLNGWDGNPDVWKVEDGAISAETWPDRRVGTTFIIWRGGEPADFELKLDVKADYDIHGGVFYRATVGPNVGRAGGAAQGRAAGVGRAAGAGRATGAAPAPGRATQAPPAVPADPRWNVRGYGIDWAWDPGNNGNVQDVGTGRSESQIAWRGHIVRTASGQRPRSIGSLGDRDEMMKQMPLGEWNQLHIIAQGRQLTHIVNGRVMAILIDDDPAGLKTKGVIALQIEQFGQGKISFRNIWLKQ